MNRIKKRPTIPAALLLLLCAALALPGCTQAGTGTTQTNPEEASTVEFTTYDLEAQELIAAMEADENLDGIDRRMQRDQELPRIGQEAAMEHVGEKYGETFTFSLNSSGGVNFTSESFPGYSFLVTYHYDLDSGRFTFRDNYAVRIIGRDVAQMMEEVLTECYGDYRITASVTASNTLMPQDLDWSATYQDMVDRDPRAQAGMSIYVENKPGMDREANALKVQQFLLDNRVKANIHIFLIEPVHWNKVDTVELRWLDSQNWHSTYAYLKVMADSAQTYSVSEIEWRDNPQVKGAES